MGNRDVTVVHERATEDSLVVCRLSLDLVSKSVSSHLAAKITDGTGLSPRIDAERPMPSGSAMIGSVNAGEIGGWRAG